MTKLLRFLRPSHQHTALSATVLLMGTVALSRVIGYAREAYIAYAFGAGSQTDAYVAAFTLPDFLNYIVAGGAAVKRPPNEAASKPAFLSGSRKRSVVDVIGLVIGVDFSLLSGEDSRRDFRIRLVILFLRGLHRI